MVQVSKKSENVAKPVRETGTLVLRAAVALLPLAWLIQASGAFAVSDGKETETEEPRPFQRLVWFSAGTTLLIETVIVLLLAHLVDLYGATPPDVGWLPAAMAVVMVYGAEAMTVSVLPRRLLAVTHTASRFWTIPVLIIGVLAFIVWYFGGVPLPL